MRRNSAKQHHPNLILLSPNQSNRRIATIKARVEFACEISSQKPTSCGSNQRKTKIKPAIPGEGNPISGLIVPHAWGFQVDRFQDRREERSRRRRFETSCIERSIDGWSESEGCIGRGTRSRLGEIVMLSGRRDSSEWRPN